MIFWDYVLDPWDFIPHAGDMLSEYDESLQDETASWRHCQNVGDACH